MAIDIEEFLNPKSMLTPGAVAAIVAIVSGAFLCTFGFALPHSSLGYRPPAPEAVLTPSEMSLESWLISKGLDIQIVQRLT